MKLRHMLRQNKTRQEKKRQINYGFLKFGFVKRIFYRPFLLLLLIFFLLIQSVLPFSPFQPKPAFAYTTGMSASVVLGQPDFTSSTVNNGGISAGTLNLPEGIEVANDKLIVADSINNRVLIWNSVPTSSQQSADVVLGQPNFTSNTANNGGISASTLDRPLNPTFVNGRLFVVDKNNNRILIWNSIPTTNQQAADLVLGQPNFASSTANNGGRTASTFSGPWDVASDGTKLAVVDASNNRVLIWNNLPTSNQQPADVVLGNNNFTTVANNATSAKDIQCFYTCNVDINNGKLFLMDKINARVLIWNSVSNVNYTSADVVIGQPDFTTATNNFSSGTNIVSSRSTRWPSGAYFDGQRLFISDHHNHRIMVFNSIPTNNYAAADFVIGQTNMETSNGLPNGTYTGSLTAATFNSPSKPVYYNGYLIVPDTNNSRIVFFNNIINNPGITLNDSPEGKDNGLLRLKGTVTIPSTSSYTISNVQYSVNGGGFSGANATDGSFSSTTEEFYFDFDPKSNQQRDSQGNLIDGYTVRIKSTNSNLDVTDNLFYFSPFNVNEPLDNAVTNSTTPTFDFSVIKQKSILNDNLSKYQIQIRKGGSNSTAPWETIIDDIPIDKANGIYETDKFLATYADDSSRIKIHSKINQLAGSMQWKVVAVDKSGHTQDSSTRSLRVNTTNSVTTSNFPLAILNISGLGNPNISTTNTSAIKDTYYLGSLTPIFYGIAYSNAKVTLTLTDQSCKSDCIKTYSTNTNQESRYGINIPKGDLKWGKKYTTNMSVAYNQDYNELPTFTLSTSGSVAKSTPTL